MRGNILNIKEAELFLGRLGNDPDLRYTPKREAVCYLSLAINRINGEETIWERVIVWGKQAEKCNLFLKKGTDVFVQGRRVQRKYDDKNGTERTVSEVKAHLIGFSNI